MKKIITIIVAIIVGILLLGAGFLIGKNLNKPQDKCVAEEKKEEKEEKEENNIIKIAAYDIEEKKSIGNISDGETDMLNSDGTIKDDYFNIEEIKNVKMKAHVDVPPTDVGGSDIYFLSQDGKVYIFGADCATVDYRDEENELDDCVSQVNLPKKVDDLKYYIPFNLEFAATHLLYSVKGELYDINFKKFNANKYEIYGGSFISGYSDGSLSVYNNDKEIALKYEKEPLKFKYIIYVDEIEETIYYIIDENDRLFKLNVDEDNYKLDYISKVTNYEFKDKTTKEDGYTIECDDYICNMTVDLENDEVYNFS